MIVGPQVTITVLCFTFWVFFTTARAERHEKSLLSSFPFNHNEHHEHKHGDHEAASADGPDGRQSRQGYEGEDDVSFDEISTGEEEADGKEGTGYYCDY